jgi:ubiquinone/menaquinone biosynthesis C-methylase UbiE
MNNKVYVCPECKAEIVNSHCVTCGNKYELEHLIPLFLSKSKTALKYQEIGSFYDQFYSKHEDSWNKLAGRGEEFNKFAASLITKATPRKYLDVGCGEGRLLRAVHCNEKYGIDVSQKALEISARDDVLCCVGCAEELPYRNDYFDVISSIGVMTHFIDPGIATTEIYRSLKTHGIYIVGIFVKPTLLEKAIYLFKNIRANKIDLFDLVGNKVIKIFNKNRQIVDREDRQPVEIKFTLKEIYSIFIKAGFTLENKISKIDDITLPFAGPHFRIFILNKKGNCK